MSRHKKHRKSLTDREAQELFARFAAPVFRAAKSPSQRKGAQRLAEALWLALVTGPEIEEAVFQSLEGVGGLEAEDLAIIKERYYAEMKPSITEEELQALKARYKVRKR
jgi:hypothetical protein